jgi:hypothetical protein
MKVRQYKGKTRRHKKQKKPNDLQFIRYWPWLKIPTWKTSIEKHHEETNRGGKRGNYAKNQSSVNQKFVSHKNLLLI